MVVQETPDTTIINAVLRLLPDDKLPTADAIRELVQGTIALYTQSRRIPNISSIDENQIIKKIESLCDIYVPEISALDNNAGHQEWFYAKRADIQWRFWSRYKQYLENNPELPPQAIRRLDDVTDQILRRLEDPSRNGLWDRRGMVVGQVQSGKTSNYTALICKAADAGYKLIVVLAGLHNSLRSQTQLRLDEGFLGFDTQQRRLFGPDNIRMGVGRLRGAELYHVHSLTTSEENGDFKLSIARQANLMIGGADPVLLVVKKNASVIKNLIKWSTKLQFNNESGTNNKVKGVPLLLIDDEADNASINTNPILDENGNVDPELDPSKINGLIRKLLYSFEKSIYIGYTATPFANIFIADNIISNEYGTDLFPRSFIINLQPPSNYFGPIKLFGLTSDPAANVTQGLPLIRHVSDYYTWIPDGHRKDYQPDALPPSLKESIKAFILTCAARQVRGQIKEHNSMLIHVTRFNAVQEIIYEQVNEELSYVLQRIKYNDGYAANQITSELQTLWENDFVPTMQRFSDPDLTVVTWSQIKEVLYEVASKIEVIKINGTAKDTLQYVEHPDGLNVICIGGDKLSRGLTLYGLSISYYLRASRMYDTLMQMGRWFGYRNGYEDLCRLYTTSDLDGWYRDITAADEELRQMFEDMADQAKTPDEYGLRVRKHPDGLMITDAKKMRTSQKILLTFSQHIVETVVFHDNENISYQNLQTTERLILQIQSRYRQQPGNKNFIWNKVDSEIIIDFLADYITHASARSVRSSLLKKYIQSRVKENELTEWTVALISIQENIPRGDFQNIADLNVGLTFRQRTNKSPDEKYRIGRLVSPKDEGIDLSEDEIFQAIEETKRLVGENIIKAKKPGEPLLPSGSVIRRIRPGERGLLLLYILKYSSDSPSESHTPIVGFSISFPKSTRGEENAIEYMVNQTYIRQEMEEDL